MNRFNKKIILFVFSALFIIYGFLGYGFNIHKGLETLHEEKEVFLEEKDIKKTIDRLTNDDLWYHDSLIDINSLNLNLMNNRIVNKGGSEFVKTESGKLSQYFSSIPDIETLNDTIDGICDLYEYASNNKCCYLYVVVPSKSQYEEFPPNAPDYSNTIYSDYVDLLSERGVPFLNCVEALKNNGIADSDVFFDTDHHWKPYSGFVISKSICESLAKAYGFIYSKEYTDINNFDIETYKDHFLGSTGKKIGQYFSWKGVDDFDLIIPKFGTDFVETVYDNGETREGNYCDTILHMNNMPSNQLPQSLFPCVAII